MNPKTITQQFLNDLTSGKLNAWEELYDEYAPRLYGLILENVPVEKSASVLENAFIEMHAHVHEYHLDRLRLFTWMYMITIKNCAIAITTSKQ